MEPMKERHTFTQKNVISSVGKLMQEAEMLRPGARIGVAVSGGEDSLLLLKILTIRKRILPFAMEVMALHINPGFDHDFHRPLLDFCNELGVALHFEQSDHGPRAHSEENLKNSACFYCCRLRRKRLFELMRTYKLTHLAMGHHADDLAATFFLNLFHGARVEGMAMREPFFNGEFELIRPLLWLEKKTISRACRQWELPTRDNPCPSATTSRRARLQRWLKSGAGLDTVDKTLRRNVLGAVRRFELSRLRSRQ
jgi:tRNA 2-thiocytidine biosynthesis protein TtcA